MNLRPYIDHLQHIDPIRWSGRVTELRGLVVESDGPIVALGDFCEIHTSSGRTVRVQVIGFRQGRILSMPLEEIQGLQPGDRIVARAEDALLRVGKGLIGRVLDGFGRPMDEGPMIDPEAEYPLFRDPPNPLSRRHITDKLVTGIKSIDSLLPCGQGQRIGIFGGSGVGKSTLLGSMAKHSSSDINVIALIGERNREVKAFIEHELGPEGRKKSIIIAATSDRPAPIRVRACFVALAISEYFRDQGANVLLVMDSVTRLAMAQREIGLAGGEPPSQKGYTPSVFSLLPKICERAGNFDVGSITAFFTVLVEGDDFNEPICDSVRGILDGHIILSRELGAAGHYPAIDILESVSRLSGQLASPEQKVHARKVREAMSSYKRAADLIQLGGHVEGRNPKLDQTIRLQPAINAFLRQDADAHLSLPETMHQMEQLAAQLPN